MVIRGSFNIIPNLRNDYHFGLLMGGACQRCQPHSVYTAVHSDFYRACARKSANPDAPFSVSEHEIK